MPETENKALLARWAEAFNARDRSCEQACRTPDFVAHVQGAAAPLDGEGWDDYLDGLLAAFRRLRLTIDDILADGDRVATRWTMCGTHEGEFLGQFPTGRTVRITGIEVARIEGCLIAERWLQLDGLGALAQISGVASAVPTTPAAHDLTRR